MDDNDKELDATPAGGAESAQTGGATATQDTPSITPEIQALIDGAVARVKQEYEGPGGHLSKLKSKKDKELAELRREQARRRDADIQQAMALAQEDPERAVPILASAVQALTAREQMAGAEEQLRDWMAGVAKELGLDENDEAVAAKMAELQPDPYDPEGMRNFTYAFLGESAKLAVERANKRAETAEAQLKALPDLVQAEVKKVLAGQGLTPDLSTPGKPAKSDDWHDLSGSQLIARALERERAAKKKP